MGEVRDSVPRLPRPRLGPPRASVYCIARHSQGERRIQSQWAPTVHIEARPPGTLPACVWTPRFRPRVAVRPWRPGQVDATMALSAGGTRGHFPPSPILRSCPHGRQHGRGAQFACAPMCMPMAPRGPAGHMFSLSASPGETKTVWELGNVWPRHTCSTVHACMVPLSWRWRQRH